MTTGQTELWHNPRCSKSRAALDRLEATGGAYMVRRYLDTPPTVEELRAVLDRLGAQPWDITRTGEQLAKDLGIPDWPRTEADRDRWIEALAANPRLIQRPIVLTPDGKAVVARDEEALKSLDRDRGADGTDT